MKRDKGKIMTGKIMLNEFFMTLPMMILLFSPGGFSGP
jgi:hypothetical protein